MISCGKQAQASKSPTAKTAWQLKPPTSSNKKCCFEYSQVTSRMMEPTKETDKPCQQYAGGKLRAHEQHG
jgi:hypothetical protein